MGQDVGLIDQRQPTGSFLGSLKREPDASSDRTRGVHAGFPRGILPSPSEPGVETLGVLPDEDDPQLGEGPEVHIEIELPAETQEDPSLQYPVRYPRVAHGPEEDRVTSLDRREIFSREKLARREVAVGARFYLHDVHVAPALLKSG